MVVERTERRGRAVTPTLFVLAGLLALLGVAGLVVARGQDQHNQRTFAAARHALGNRDAADAADVLERRNASLRAAFEDYVQAEQLVRETHETETAAANHMVGHINRGEAWAVGEAQRQLGTATLAYRIAVRRERVAHREFLKRLAVFTAKAAR